MTQPTPTDESKLSDNVETAQPRKEALAQAEAYESLFAPQPLKLDGGGVIKVPPHPDYGMLTDENMEAYDRLMFEMDTEYEREEDIFIPEAKLRDEKGNETGVSVPSSTVRGAIKQPYRRKGEDGKSVLVTPPHTIRIVQVCLGEAEYKRLKDGGRNASDVWAIWRQQSIKIRERQQSDSFPARRDVDVETVPASDS